MDLCVQTKTENFSAPNFQICHLDWDLLTYFFSMFFIRTIVSLFCQLHTEFPAVFQETADCSRIKWWLQGQSCSAYSPEPFRIKDQSFLVVSDKICWWERATSRTTWVKFSTGLAKVLEWFGLLTSFSLSISEPLLFGESYWEAARRLLKNTWNKVRDPLMSCTHDINTIVLLSFLHK